MLKCLAIHEHIDKVIRYQFYGDPDGDIVADTIYLFAKMQGNFIMKEGF